MITVPQASTTSKVFEVPSLIAENGVPCLELKIVSSPVGTTYEVRNRPTESNDVGRFGHELGPNLFSLQRFVCGTVPSLSQIVHAGNRLFVNIRKQRDSP